MVPESAENNCVTLYRCISFPDKWQLEHHLLQGIAAYDSTFFCDGNLWWLFANVQSHTGASSWDELCIFYANSPISTNWFPHRLNPVVSDVRNARPAGSLFRSNGRIFRPSQDSSSRYGFGLNIMEILELSKDNYRETEYERVFPIDSRRVKGIHTYSRSACFLATDAIIREKRAN
jgi:hypothetical protein